MVSNLSMMSFNSRRCFEAVVSKINVQSMKIRKSSFTSTAINISSRVAPQLYLCEHQFGEVLRDWFMAVRPAFVDQAVLTTR